MATPDPWEPFAGVDYSTKAIHYAVVQGPSLLDYGDYPLTGDLRNQVALMVRMIGDIQASGARTVYVETPWVREGKGMQTALVLHRIPIRFEALAIERGLSVSWVPVQTWRLVVFNNGGMRTDQAKAVAKDYVLRNYGVRVADDNAADAACLATYGAAIERGRFTVATARS